MKTNTNLTSVGWSFKIVGDNFKAAFADVADKAAPVMRTFADATSEWIQLVTNFINSPAFKIITFGPRTVAKVEGWGLRQYFKLFSGGRDMKLKDSGPAPQPQSWMKQLPASSWEKMGLVIGGGGGANPAMQTAHNTKSMAQDMKKLVSYLARGGGAGTFNLQNAP